MTTAATPSPSPSPPPTTARAAAGAGAETVAETGKLGAGVRLDGVSVTVRGAGWGGAKRPVVLLDAVSLEIPAGSAWTLIGPSGAGKTTLLRVIAGFVAPSAGVVMMDGRHVAANGRILVEPGDRRIGYLPQDLGLWDHLTVEAHLDVAIKAGQPPCPRADRRARVRALAQQLGLGDMLPRRAGTLSGGERHRLAFGRAMAAEPRLLLLDEPFAGLDYALRDDLAAQFAQWRRATSTTVVVVTHLRDELAEIEGEAGSAVADGVAVIESGRVAEIGPLDAIASRPQTAFAKRFFGS